jgi:uncharacterized protein YecE (DUF72 family)
VSKTFLFQIGTAGWTLPKAVAGRFAAEGSHLERYAGGFNCVEVNSSFHRPHRRATWERWARSVPEGFRFSVKMPKRITHEAKLVGAGAALLEFFEQVGGLEDKLGPVLVQLPPKLAFDEGVVREFLGTVRELYAGALVCEPRHASWFNGADALLREFGVGRVAADPPKGSGLAGEPAGDVSVRYWRLHGAPRAYYSDYDEAFLRGLADRLIADAALLPASERWVIFDNTALGCATGNALRLTELLGAQSRAKALVFLDYSS